jgi:hypothetical protein
MSPSTQFLLSLLQYLHVELKRATHRIINQGGPKNSPSINHARIVRITNITATCVCYVTKFVKKGNS